MRVLILSCNTGEGHNSCAKALKEIFESKGHHCIIEDSLRFISQNTSDVISKGHTFVYRNLPGLFRWGYRYAETHSEIYRKGTVLRKYFASGQKRLADYIDNEGFDTVICTHVFSGVILTDAKKKCRTSFKTAFVATDYTCSPTTEASSLDVYFIPDESIRKEYTDYGIPSEKLKASGIPVRQMFYRKNSFTSAKSTFGIAPDSRHILVMCGSMGCGPIENLTNNIANRLDDNEEMTIVCGTNQKLFRRLKKLHNSNPNIHIRGYVKNISMLMDSADVFVTKPGGISVTEAKIKHKPMIFVDAVAGCEEYNLRFFTDRGCALSGHSISELTEKCIFLLRDNDKLTSMSKSFSVFPYINSAEYICDYLAENSSAEVRNEKI